MQTTMRTIMYIQYCTYVDGCVVVIMYSRGVVILSIGEKRLSAILHILLVIGTYYNVHHNTRDVLWNTQDVLEYLKLCAAVYYKKVVLRFILGSPIKSYRHQTIQGKKEVLVPNFIVTRRTKEKRRFSYLILLSPDKGRKE